MQKLIPPELSREYLLYHRLCPESFSVQGHLQVAAASDARRDAFDDLAVLYGCEIGIREVPGHELERLIEHAAAQAERLLEFAPEAKGLDDLTADVRDLATQPPVIRFVNLVLTEAHEACASDVHLEATREGLVSRFRLDGALADGPVPPAGLDQAVISRLKLLASMDIAERRRPQDGRIRVRLREREIDLRVSTVPTMFGESVVLRLLDQGDRPGGLDELGMPPAILAGMRSLARRPHGMVLVTGPTGSGKTTTLYSSLRERNSLCEKLITVEDPVEYQLPGVTQVPVHRHAGVEFVNVLRSILRQDPDVVMIGEMRDAETAELAVQAAMTGHLVFSTLHTNDVIGVVPRLLDLGVPEYLLMATLEGALAQRLVRRICLGCAESYEPPAEAISALADEAPLPNRFLRGTGCGECRDTGYRGRVGIFELLVFTDALREAIRMHRTGTDLRAVAGAAGWRSLRADGWEKVCAGLTTVEEVLRVVQE